MEKKKITHENMVLREDGARRTNSRSSKRKERNENRRKTRINRGKLLRNTFACFDVVSNNFAVSVGRTIIKTGFDGTNIFLKLQSNHFELIRDFYYFSRRYKPKSKLRETWKVIKFKADTFDVKVKSKNFLCRYQSFVLRPEFILQLFCPFVARLTKRISLPWLYVAADA